MAIKKIHVYDCDGVLVDSSHRYRNKADGSIDLEYWFENHHKALDDSLLPLAKQYQADCKNPEIYTVICTARAEHSLDKAFFREVLGQPDKLIMRPYGSRSPDSRLKLFALRSLFNLRQFNKLHRRLWEDNKKNIAALVHLFDSCYYVPSKITENK